MVKIGYYIIIGLLKVVSLLPLKIHYFFSDILAFLLGKVLKYRYSTIMINLGRSFPDLDYKKLTDIAWDFYKFMADTIAESVWAYSASREEIGKQVKIEGIEVLEEAYNKRKNVAVMLGHIGNWELFTGLPHLKNFYGMNIENKSFTYVYKKPTSKLAHLVINKIREKHDACSIIESKNIIRHIIKDKEGKNIFFFICDQCPSARESDFEVTFLNQNTYMLEGPEYIASKVGMPVVYCGVERRGRRDNTAVLKLICEDASAMPKGEVTQKFAEYLEEDIKKYKHTWLWSHRRWKRKA